MYKASICITLRSSILDPQGKAVHHALENLGYDAVERVRMGKYVEMWFDVASDTAVAADAILNVVDIHQELVTDEYLFPCLQRRQFACSTLSGGFLRFDFLLYRQGF